MISRGKEAAGFAVSIGITLITITSMLTLFCWRGGCTRTILGRWLVDQGGLLAAVVRGVEVFWLVVALFAFALVLLEGARDRLDSLLD